MMIILNVLILVRILVIILLLHSNSEIIAEKLLYSRLMLKRIDQSRRQNTSLLQSHIYSVFEQLIHLGVAIFFPKHVLLCGNRDFLQANPWRNSQPSNDIAAQFLHCVGRHYLA